jgi:hypothetical protein
MKSLTVVFITARKEPCFEWFWDSLCPQIKVGEIVDVIVVDLHCEEPGRVEGFLRVPPMPNVWQGPHRLTNCDVWAIATAKNTALCLARTEWIAYCDDRAVLGDHWLESVKEAMRGEYVVTGSYEKRTGMIVENGKIVDYGTLIGDDHRAAIYPKDRAVKCKGSQLFGVTQALPVEWLLRVNGFDETCNGLGLEDCMLGCMLVNNKRRVRYDYRMHLTEDRTGNGVAPIKRKDKGVSPNDKSHALVALLEKQKKAIHDRDIRAIRETVLRGEPFPIPTTPTHDWWDGTPLAEEHWP